MMEVRFCVFGCVKPTPYALVVLHILVLRLYEAFVFTRRVDKCGLYVHHFRLMEQASGGMHATNRGPFGELL